MSQIRPLILLSFIWIAPWCALANPAGGCAGTVLGDVQFDLPETYLKGPQRAPLPHPLLIKHPHPLEPLFPDTFYDVESDLARITLRAQANITSRYKQGKFGWSHNALIYPGGEYVYSRDYYNDLKLADASKLKVNAYFATLTNETTWQLGFKTSPYNLGQTGTIYQVTSSGGTEYIHNVGLGDNPYLVFRVPYPGGGYGYMREGIGLMNKWNPGGFGNGIYRFVSLLNDSLHLDVVGPSVLAEVGGVPRVIAKEIEGDFLYSYEGTIETSSLLDAMGFSYLIGLADTHGGNFKVTSNLRIKAFDFDDIFTSVSLREGNVKGLRTDARRAALKANEQARTSQDYELSSNHDNIIGEYLPPQYTEAFIQNLTELSPDAIKQLWEKSFGPVSADPYSEKLLERVLFKREVLLADAKNRSGAFFKAQ